MKLPVKIAVSKFFKISTVVTTLATASLMSISLQPLPAAADDNGYVTEKCIDFSVEGFRFMVTNFCKNDIGDLWICRSPEHSRSCEQPWSKVGALDIRDSARVMKVSQKPGMQVLYRACYAPKVIEEDSNGGFRCV